MSTAVVSIERDEDLCHEKCPFRKHPDQLPVEYRLDLQDDWEFCTLFQVTLEPDRYLSHLNGVKACRQCDEYFLWKTQGIR